MTNCLRISAGRGHAEAGGNAELLRAITAAARSEFCSIRAQRPGLVACVKPILETPDASLV
jgi:hypothetical protein